MSCSRYGSSCRSGVLREYCRNRPVAGKKSNSTRRPDAVISGRTFTPTWASRKTFCTVGKLRRKPGLFEPSSQWFALVVHYQQVLKPLLIVSTSKNQRG